MYLLLRNIKSFSETVSTAATVLFAIYTLNKRTLNNLIKRFFLVGDNNQNEKHKYIQVLSYKIPMISLVQRILTNQFSQQSLIATTPLSPIVPIESVKYMKVLSRNITEFILPVNEEQVKGVELMQQEMSRFIDLMYKEYDKNIEVKNIMIFPIYAQLLDLIIISPLLNFAFNPQAENKLLTTTCSQIIDQVLRIEPEIVFNSVMNYIDYCVSSMAQSGNMSAIGNNTMTTMNTTLNIDMQADLHK